MPTAESDSGSRSSRMIRSVPGLGQTSGLSGAMTILRCTAFGSATTRCFTSSSRRRSVSRKSSIAHRDTAE